MDLWPYFLVTAVICAALDKTLGLAFIFYGFAILFLVIGLAGAAGINILDYELLVDLLVAFIFIPITVRLFFVLHSQLVSGEVKDVKKLTGLGCSEDRNAKTVYKGILIAGKVVPLFTYHFVTGGWAFAAIATIIGWIEPNGSLIALALITFPFATGFIAAIRGVSGGWKILWSVAGLIFGVIISVFITFATITATHQLTTQL